LKSPSTNQLKSKISKNENSYPSILPSFRSNDEETRERIFKEQERLEAIEYYQKLKKEKYNIYFIYPFYIIIFVFLE
jgi:hypothetical protein